MSQPIRAIAAMNNKRVIGAGNTIPWHSHEDFKRFKTLTEGGVVIMGRKTWDSLPKKPLPGRLNIIVTRNPQGLCGDLPMTLERVSVEEAIAAAREISPERDIWIIGGALIYGEAMVRGLIDEVELTVVDDDSDGDARMPLFEPLFERVSEEKLLDTSPKLTFYSFRRKPT